MVHYGQSIFNTLQKKTNNWTLQILKMLRHWPNNLQWQHPPCPKHLRKLYYFKLLIETNEQTDYTNLYDNLWCAFQREFFLNILYVVVISLLHLWLGFSLPKTCVLGKGWKLNGGSSVRRPGSEDPQMCLFSNNVEF